MLFLGPDGICGRENSRLTIRVDGVTSTWTYATGAAYHEPPGEYLTFRASESDVATGDRFYADLQPTTGVHSMPGGTPSEDFSIRYGAVDYSTQFERSTATVVITDLDSSWADGTFYGNLFNAEGDDSLDMTGDFHLALHSD